MKHLLVAGVNPALSRILLQDAVNLCLCVSNLCEGLQHRHHVVFLHAVGAVGVEQTSCIHQPEH